MRRILLLAMCGVLALSKAAVADDWVMTITVDNQYDIYFGTDTTTTFHAGGDNNWFTVETWNAFGRGPRIICTSRPHLTMVWRRGSSDTL